MSAPVFAAVTPHPPIIVPEVGRGQERETQATLDAFARLRDDLAGARPDVLLFICPHGPLRQDEFVVLRGPLDGDLRRFGAGSVRFQQETDVALVDGLLAAAESRGVRLRSVEQWEADDHSLWVPLYHLRAAAPAARVVVLSISFGTPQAHYDLGCAIADVLREWPQRVAIIASADGAHALREDGPYGYHPLAPVFEEEFQAAFEAWDRDWILSTDQHYRAQAAEDSIPSVAILMGALSPWSVRPQILASEAPWGVGYMTARIEVQDIEVQAKGVQAIEVHESAGAGVVTLARAAVEAHVRNAPDPSATTGNPVLARHAGAFVSIHTGAGQLRGCIGTIEPRRATLAQEIIDNAVAAARDDPRFTPVEPDELARLTYKVDVLEPPEPIDDASALDPARYGVVVEAGQRRGVLLPALEGIDRAEEQVRIAREKAGIRPEEPVALFRFRVTRYEEGAGSPTTP